MAVILHARGLNKSFGAVTAASNVDVRVEKDSIVGLIGANGAGKTTFINLITGYLKPDTGAILFEERDITRLPPREITRLGICRSFQMPQLYSSLSVYQNMMVGLGVVLRNAGRGGYFSRGRPQVPGYDAPAEEVADRILDRFGLAGRALCVDFLQALDVAEGLDPELGDLDRAARLDVAEQALMLALEIAPNGGAIEGGIR